MFIVSSSDFPEAFYNFNRIMFGSPNPPKSFRAIKEYWKEKYGYDVYPGAAGSVDFKTQENYLMFVLEWS